MNNTCQNYVVCGNSPVLINYNAQTPDVFSFIGLGFGPVTPPPLGWTYDKPTAFAIRKSVYSQTDADNQAYTAAVALAESGWTPPGGVVPIHWEDLTNDNPSDVFIGQVGGIDSPLLV